MDLEQMKYFEILMQIDLVKFFVKGELLIVMRHFFPHSYCTIRASFIALSKKRWVSFHLNMLLYLWKKGESEGGRWKRERERWV